MPTIPDIEPTSVVSGDTIKFTKSLADYPATLWDLIYEFRGKSQHTVICGKSGDAHTFSVPKTDSANWNPGEYWWQAHAIRISDGERYTVVKGRLVIEPNLADADVVADYRSHVKKVLDAIEATIEGNATKDQLAYTIAGRTLQRVPPNDLKAFRDSYKLEYEQELAKEKDARGETSGRRVLVRFTG